MAKISIEVKLQPEKEYFYQEMWETYLCFKCASFDHQKVINIPFGDSMMLFYSRKYSYFNLTVHKSGTREGYCICGGRVMATEVPNEITIQMLDADGETDHLSQFY